jgi:hypothetical protein
MAGAGLQAGFVAQHVVGQAVGGQQQIALVGLAGPAHGRGVGAGNPPHLGREAGRQRVEAAGLRQEGADLVQVGQPLPLHLQAGGLFAYLFLQAGIERLQRASHLVETGRQLAELVLRARFHPGGQVALLDRHHRAFQARDRAEHQQIAGVHQGHGAGDGQRHHRQLEQVQDGRPAGDLSLDAADEAVDQRHEVIGLARRRRGDARAGLPGAAQLGPAGLEVFELLARAGGPRHHQRARRVARLQQADALVELATQVGQLRRVGGAVGGQGQPVGLHPHPAGLVDGRGAAFQAPCHPQRQADRGQRQQQEAQAGRDQLGREGPAHMHQASLGRPGHSAFNLHQGECAPVRVRQRACGSSRPAC